MLTQDLTCFHSDRPKIIKEDSHGSPAAMTLQTITWCIEDYHRMIEVGLLAERRVELLRGEIVKMSPEGPEHAQLSTDTADYLRQLLGSKVLIRDAKPISLPEQGSEPEPDIAIVHPFRSVYHEHHPYPEQIFWVIEYANSSLTKDLEIKRKLYAQAGILEYWLVDLQHQEVIIFRDPINDDYCSQVNLIEGEIIPLSFPDIRVSLGRLLKG